MLFEVPWRFLSLTNTCRSPKHCGNNNKDEDNSLKTLNDKNQQAWSQKFRQLMSIIVGYLMPNPIYTYILNIYDWQTHFVGNIIKWAWAHFFAKW